MAFNSSILGAAGEHYVMCQLLRMNLIAALAPKGVPTADIVVTNTVGDLMCAVQVKTRRDAPKDGPWQMKAKHEEIRSSGLFYVFVSLGAALTDPPRSWVLPAPIVADVLERSHRAWLAGATTKQRNDSNMRTFYQDYSSRGIEIGRPKGWMDPYFENWDPIRELAAGEERTS